jgi:O-antigen ligase
MNPPAQIPVPVPVLACVVGLAAGVLLVLTSTATSPLMALLLFVGLVVALGVLANPTWGMLLTAAVIPIERLGRFTDDSSMYTFSLMRVVGLLALGSFLLHALVKKWKLNFGTAFLLYSSYLSLAILTVTYTTDQLGTVRACGAIVGNLMFFFLIVNVVRGWRLANAVVVAWLGVSVLIGLYTIYDWHSGSGAIEESRIGVTETRLSTVWVDKSEWESLRGVRRAMGTTSHAAVYGINMILTLPFLLYFVRALDKPKLKLVAFGSLVVVVFNILLTNTRAAILLAGLVLTLCLVWGLIRFKRSWVVPALLVGATLLVFVPNSIYKRVLDISNYSFERSGTFRIRMEYWNAGLKVAEENWLTGVGVGNQNAIPKHIKGLGPKQTTVHNEYLQTFIEVGVLGWVLFFSFVGLLLWQARQAAAVFRQRGDARDKYWFMVACQIAMISVLVYGIQVDVFHFPLKGWWLVAGLSWVISGMALRGRRAQVTPLAEGTL